MDVPPAEGLASGGTLRGFSKLYRYRGHKNKSGSGVPPLWDHSFYEAALLEECDGTGRDVRAPRASFNEGKFTAKPMLGKRPQASRRYYRPRTARRMIS